ncbi:MAG: Crp/Fnr family transcriptional regulator [Bacteroidales bacterium]|jgi:CRP-like cAMP-binding protein|nr:Crp/Fnr family transcriptional regulator [Bacteroidales bacterium]
MDMTCQCEFCDLKDIFYSSISAEDLNKYCASRHQRNVRAGEYIIKQGDDIKDFIYLKEGLVKLFRESNQSQTQIISFGKPFDFVSLLSVFSDEKYNYSVSAVMDSVACIFDLSDIKQLIKTNGDFALHLMQTQNKSSDRIIMNSLSLLQKRLYGRVATVLLYFAIEIFKSDEYELPVSRKEIAQYIGMSIENVIRAISAFRKDKIIQVYGKNLAILDRFRLEQMRDFS